jgi:hypothetical protein
MSVGGQTISSINNFLSQASIVKQRLGRSGSWLNSVGKDIYGIDSNFRSRRRGIISNPPADEIKQPILPNPDEHGKNQVSYMFLPPLGIFDYTGVLGSGDYRITLNPSSNYLKSAIETISDAGRDRVNDGDIKFEVASIEFYVATIKLDIPSSGVTSLTLMETSVLSKKMGGQNANLDFQVPSSTTALTFCVQEGNAGSTTEFSPSIFKCGDGDEKTLRSIQVSFANQVKPPTNIQSNYIGGINHIKQRYTDTIIETGQIHSDGGCESFSQWLTSPIYHYDFVRDSEDRSSQLQVNINYSTMDAATNLFVIAHYSRRVDITTTNGFISSVNLYSI